jgi:MFS family permease
MSCIGLALCSFLFSWAIKGRDTEVPIEKPDLGDTRLLDFKILAPAILTFFTSFSLGGLFAFIPLYGLKCGITNPGFFFSAIAVMLFTGRTVGGKILVASRKDQVIPLCMTVMMIALVILSFSRTLPFFILVGLIWGAGLSFVSPASMAYALEYAGSSGGPALGTYQMFMDLGLALGPVVMGILVPVTGYPVMFLVLAFICLVNIGYFQFYVKRKALNR